FGTRWGTAADARPVAAAASRSAPATPAGAAPPATVPSVPSVPSVPAGAAPPAATADPSAGPDLLASPDDPAGWVPVVEELYRRRAAAFTTASTQPLTGAYTDGSDRLAADTAFVG